MRLQVVQAWPCQRVLNWSSTPSIRAGDSVQIPISKLRRPSALAPRPAPVRLALPRYMRELKRELPRGLTIRRCPRLHSKAVIIDARSMYLGSANLTGAGLGAKSDGRRNFEMGIWTTSPALVDGVMEQFNQLWEGHCCEGCQRKDICPVPLEEPAL